MSSLYFFQSPNISKEELAAVLFETAKKSKSTFDEKLKLIESLILKFSPEQSTAILSYYTTVIGANQVRGKEDGTPPVLPAYVEFVQALAIKNHLIDFEYHPILTGDLQELTETITALFLSEMKTMYSDILSQTSDETQNIAFFQSYIRNRTKIERDWAYPFQVEKIANDLFKTVDSEFIKKFDISIHEVLDCFDLMINKIQERITKHVDSLTPIIRAKSSKDALKAYHKSINANGTVLDLEPQFREQGITSESRKLEIVRMMVLGHSDLRLPDIFMFSEEELKNISQKGEYLWSLLQSLSLAYGSLKNERIDYFFMANPILEKPFIFHEEALFIPCPWILSNNRIDIIEALIQNDKQLNKYYLEKQIRGNFLEEKVYQLFRSNFPEALFFRGSIVKKGNSVVTENDLLVIMDHIAIVIESKSAKLSASAKRGSRSRLEKDLSSLITKASQQIDLFCDHLIADQWKNIIRLETKKAGVYNQFDVSHIKHWIKLIITIEPLGILSTTQPNLVKSGLLRHTGQYAPLLALPDLEIIFDVLKRKSNKLHYLFSRRFLELDHEYFADEFDLLMLYTETGFNLAKNQTSYFLYDLSGSLHQFYRHNNFIGSKGKRPQLKLTEWWQRIISTIEERQTFGWALITSYLLTVTQEGQSEIQRNAELFKKQLKKLPPKKCSYGIYDSNFGDADFTILVFVYKDFTKEERDNTIFSILDDLIKKRAIREFVVLGFNMNQSHRPYGLAAYYSFKEEK